MLRTAGTGYPHCTSTCPFLLYLVQGSGKRDWSRASSWGKVRVRMSGVTGSKRTRRILPTYTQKRTNSIPTDHAHSTHCTIKQLFHAKWWNRYYRHKVIQFFRSLSSTGNLNNLHLVCEPTPWLHPKAKQHIILTRFWPEIVFMETRSRDLRSLFLVKDIHNVITLAKFGDDRLRGSGSGVLLKMEVGIRTKGAWRKAWRYPAYLWSLRWVYAVKKIPEVGIRRIPAYTPPQYTTGFRGSCRSNFSISHWLCWSSLQHSHTTMWACDMFHDCRWPVSVIGDWSKSQTR